MTQWACGWIGRGCDAWGGQVAPAAYGAAVGVVQEGAEVGEAVRGSLVNKSKFQNQFCNFQMFSLFLASNEKVLNTTFAQCFEIYNFRVIHFFIRAMV